MQNLIEFINDEIKKRVQLVEIMSWWAKEAQDDMRQLGMIVAYELVLDKIDELELNKEL